MPQSNRIPEFIDRLNAEVRAAVQAGAERVMEGAKDRAPVESGALRDSIHTEPAEDGVRVVAGGKVDGKDVFYAEWVEHGTAHAAPHPFLIPALEENAEQIVEDVRDAMRRSAR